MSDQRRTIRVHCVVNSLGQVGLALMRQDWRGPRRLDYRLMRMTQVPAADAPPLGVDADLWLAYSALRQAVTRQVLAHQDGHV
jgi:hypothetical protein